jgi:hypothetical protein
MFIFSIYFVIACTTVFLFFANYLKTFMKTRTTTPIIPKLMYYNNVFYGFVSLFMFIYGVTECFKRGIHTNTHSTLLTIYYFSKIYEMSDLILVLLNKGEVSVHFLFHHSTTLSLVWVCIEKKFIYLPLLLVSFIYY